MEKPDSEPVTSQEMEAMMDQSESTCSRIFRLHPEILLVKVLDSNAMITSLQEKPNLLRSFLSRPLVNEKLIVAWGLLSSITRSGLDSFSFEVKGVTIFCVPYKSELFMVVLPSEKFTQEVKKSIISIVTSAENVHRSTSGSKNHPKIY